MRRFFGGVRRGACIPVAVGLWACACASSAGGYGTDTQGGGNSGDGIAPAQGSGSSTSSTSSGAAAAGASASGGGGSNAPPQSGGAASGTPSGSGPGAAGGSGTLYQTYVPMVGTSGSSGASGAADGGTHVGDATSPSPGGPSDAGGGATVMHHDAAPVVLAGCAATVPSAIFGASCENRACHNSNDREYNLDLQSAGVASRLVNVPSIEVPSLKLVDPIAPLNSFLLLKVKDMQPPAGVQMPQMGTKLSAAQVQCLQDWVTAEAAGPY